MLINLNELDLIKAFTWREELHPRDKNGRFAGGHSWTGIRKGSEVVAKNGTKGKVTQVTDTHYQIEKDDGKTSRILKENVIHSKDHEKLVVKKKPASKRAPKGATANDKKVPTKPKTPTTRTPRSAQPKPASSSKRPARTATKKPPATTDGAKGATDAKKKAPVKKAPTKKEPAKKPPAKKPATAKGETASATTKPATKAKPTATRGKSSPASGARSNVGGTKKAPATSGGKDIRTKAQQNRELAYDVGDKVGGARKDDYEKRFKLQPTLEGLKHLEKENGAVAEKLVTKANLLPKFDLEAERANGLDLETALLKKLIYDRVAPKPEAKTPEAREAYMQSLQKLQRHLEGIKTWDNMRDAVYELSDIGRSGKYGRSAENKLQHYRSNPGNYSYFNEESYTSQAKKGEEARKMLDMEPLGTKLENFFTDVDSRTTSMTTARRNARVGWDEYLGKKATASKPKAERGSENKKWERKAEAEDLRTGGKALKVEKPEDFMKKFNVRGVEFGHWVNDSSGKYHLQRSAEAFSDLAGVLGIDDQDVSLNGRLAIAFGARGKGGALAHYEPDRKVINMTKYGGAGSLAHEWGHAMDNILYQYSHGGKESMGLASEEPMGSKDPKLNMLYDHLVDTIRKPAPGEKGAIKRVEVDSSNPANRQSHYYPNIRREFQHSDTKTAYNYAVGVMQNLANKQQAIIDQYEPLESRIKGNPEIAKAPQSKRVLRELNGARRELSKIHNSMPHIIANEMAIATGEPYKGTIEIPTGNSEYYQRMLEVPGGKGATYWGSNAEMFARVFESYVEDKLSSKKQYNNYLVHGTTERHVKAMDAPFPLGKEREHMFKAMDNLLAHVTKGQTLKKALELEVLRKSLGYTKRSAYNVPNEDEVIYIPVNRLRTPYQTEQATNFDKVHENFERMKRGESLEPVVIGYDYDLHDGHHRVEATCKMDYTHVPCVVMQGSNDIERQRAIDAYQEVWKSFNEGMHPRDTDGRFSKVYHTTKDKNFKHDPSYKNSGQEWGSGLYTAPAEDVEYWHKALADKVTGERHPYVMPLDISKARLLHVKDIPDRNGRAKALIAHFGSGNETLKALEKEEKEHVTGETYDKRPHEIAEYRVYAKINGYDGIVAHDRDEGHQVVLFDDSKVNYEPAMGIDDFVKRKRWGEL